MQRCTGAPGGEASAVDDGGVVELIREDCTLRRVGEGAEDGEVGGVARRKEQRLFGLLQRGERRLQLSVRVRVATHESGSPRAAAVRECCCGRRLAHCRVCAEAQVVVGGEYREPHATCCCLHLTSAGRVVEHLLVGGGADKRSRQPVVRRQWRQRAQRSEQSTLSEVAKLRFGPRGPRARGGVRHECWRRSPRVRRARDCDEDGRGIWKESEPVYFVSIYDR
eukprot:scaffold37611_cov69-Phaeocystis_antarctica.AAC.7